MATNDNNNIIIARQQQRRGLKQDLPQPLRPGELGFTVDSKQLFIGGDPDHPNASQYNNASAFEKTVNAREHTKSIANNQILYFTVPFVKYSRGEYNGITTVKQWQPSFARSIISSSLRPECKHTSSDYPVFSNDVTRKTSTDISIPTVSGSTIYVNGVPTIDDYANIRVGDIANIETTTGYIKANVQNIFRDTGTGDYVVNIDQTVTTPLGGNVEFEYRSITNFLTGKAFTSDDVIVSKNGIRLSGDTDDTNDGVPAPEFDYTFSTNEIASSGIHKLVLRSRPTISDEVTVCYYSNSAVIQALTGSQGVISAYADIPSFYSEYNVPEYRQIAPENVRVSTTTGLGFIGLENKHVQSVADSYANVNSITGLTLGNLLVSRNDQLFLTANCDIETDPTQFTVETSSIISNIFSPVTEQSGAYRYNRIKLSTPNAENRYFHNRHFDVLAVDTNNGLVTFEIPTKEFDLTRQCNVDLGSIARYPGNGYTGVGTQTVATIKGNTDGVAKNDYVRIVDEAGTNELHDTIFKVLAVRTGQIDVRLDTAGVYSGNAIPNFTTNHTGLWFANHGSDSANVNLTIQAFCVNSELTSEVSNVNITNIEVPYSTGIQTIDNTSLGDNTFYVTNYNVNAGSVMANTTGEFYPALESSYDSVYITPVLAINLAANTTLAEAVTTINQPLVSTKLGFEPEQIFPRAEYVEQADNSLNRIYLTQDPGYSSVDAGGLEFSLFEDRNVPTLQVLKLTPDEYNRDNNTVRAKLEKWMNQMMIGRDVNLFSNIMINGTPYKDFPYLETRTSSRFYNETIPYRFDSYSLTIDDTYQDILFCERLEAANFNYIVNNAYAQSPYDRSEDDFDGARGLVNIKTNIEIQTREQAGIGATTLNFPTTSSGEIQRTDGPGSEVFRVPIDVYNSYIIEYTINDAGANSIDSYSRVGSIMVVARPDLVNTAINDRYASVWNKVDGAPVVEPRFLASLDGDELVLTLEEQFRDIFNPVPGDTLAHSFDADLIVKFHARRWSSFYE